LLKKIGAITAVDALTKLLSYLLLPVYLGLMPKIEFGEFGFLTGALGYASMILGLSMYVPFIRNYCAVESELEKLKLVSTIFTSLLAWIVFIDILLIVLKPLLLEAFAHFFEITVFADKKYYLVILAINSGIASLYCYSLLMARKTTREIIIFTLIKFFVLTMFNLLILYTDPWQQDTVVNRLLSTVVAELAITLGYVATTFRPYLKLTLDQKLLKSNLLIAIPLIPSALVGLFIAVIDRRLIAQHHGLADLANYNLAIQALVPIQMLMSAVQVAWAPHLFSVKDNCDALRQSMHLIWIALAIMVVATLIIFLIFYFAIYVQFISFEYKQVPFIILFASIGVIFGSLIQLNNNMFVQLAKTELQLWVAIFMLIVNWSMNLYLVPIYSSYGAAMSAGASNVLALAFGLYLLNKTLKRESINVV
jgi:O-antigen/teichoic acid export membrane protein